METIRPVLGYRLEAIAPLLELEAIMRFARQVRSRASCMSSVFLDSFG